MTKITNISALETAIKTLSAIEGVDAEVIAKLTNIKASYAKKSNAPKKPTATQVANEATKSSIVEILGNADRMTVGEITKALDGDYTSQKISALLRQLVADGAVTRTEEKRKAYFSIAADDSAQYLDREVSI